MKQFIQSLVIVLVFLLPAALNAQPIHDSVNKKIDSLFLKWNSSNSPGATIGIIKGDSLIYSKGYGMANIEYGIPNSPKTIFHMASVSKQFTAYALILLEARGKLRLDDDIRQYLTWFPDMDQKITIRNLLNHTSGIRDQWQLLAISGTRLDDVITQDHIIKLLGQQRELNFKPGERFSYSNSGYTMAAEIVKSVTGKTLRQFADSAIFKPLGMNNTHFHDDYTEVVPGRSYSYHRKSSDKFGNSVLSYSNAGATSLFTNIEDLAKWVRNFYDIKVGDSNTINALQRTTSLNNGKPQSYAQGIFVGQRNGYKELSHTGGDAGFATFLAVYPTEKMGFIVLANIQEVNPMGKTYDMVDMFLKNGKADPGKGKITIDSSLAVIKDSMSVKPILGSYLSEEGIKFTLSNFRDMLYLNDGRRMHLLSKQSNSDYTLLNDTAVHVHIRMINKDTILNIATPNEVFTAKKFWTEKEIPLNRLKEITGTYICPELNTNYSIELKDKELWLIHQKYNDSKITVIGPNNLSTGNWWMSNLVIRRNNKNVIEGFNVTSGRIRGLKFNKVK